MGWIMGVEEAKNIKMKEKEADKCFNVIFLACAGAYTIFVISVFISIYIKEG